MMFIYKITIQKKVYIGFDTHPEHRKMRFNTHLREATQKDTKLARAITNNSIEDIHYEVIERGFTSIVKLALAEIDYIAKYDSYRRGLNSSPGGDGIGKYDLHTLQDEDVEKLLQILSERQTIYNIEQKWARTSAQERKEMVSHLHNEEVYAKKGATLRETYANNPDLVEQRSKQFKESWSSLDNEAYEERCSKNRVNSAKGAAKVSIPLTVMNAKGEVLHYKSKREFMLATNIHPQTLRNRSLKGLYTKDYIEIFTEGA